MPLHLPQGVQKHLDFQKYLHKSLLFKSNILRTALKETRTEVMGQLLLNSYSILIVRI